MLKQISELYGRQVMESQINPKLLKDRSVQKLPAIVEKDGQVICQRCGSKIKATEVELPGKHYYCPKCIALGRINSGNMWTIPEPNDFPQMLHPLTWRGELTKSQKRCSKRVITKMKLHQDLLLWAVTGAGKTEMMFPGITWAIEHRLRICWSSPRVDVCLEIYPRLQAAFQQIPIALLHGRAKEAYHYTQLVVCTTHQLLKFRRAFDVLIIDEADSFPFVHNQALHYGAKHAVKDAGSTFYLTATPQGKLLEQVHLKKLSTCYLPLRFHRHLLPVIHCHLIPHWRRRFIKGKIPERLMSSIQEHLKQRHRFLLFVAKIKDLRPLSKILKRRLGKQIWETVHSEDPKRLEKVQMMRDHQVQFLITTTILERGVTFPGIDVIILGADEAAFSVASLVQIAGRVGRKEIRPNGNVDFFIGTYTRAIVQAQKQINHMNALGAKLL